MKSVKIIILIVAWICSIVCTAVVVSVVKDNSYEPKQSVSANDEEYVNTQPSDSVSQMNYENWGFENIEEWGGALLQIYPDENGNYVFSDDKGQYVRTIIDEFSYIQFYPEKEELAWCSLSDEHTLRSSNLFKYRVLDNNTIARMDFSGTMTSTWRIESRINEDGVYIGLWPDYDYGQSGIIPYQYINAEMTMEFCESVDMGSEYFEDYKDLYKVYLK